MPKGPRKFLFELKGTCMLEKVTYPLAPTSAAARVDFGKDLTANLRQFQYNRMRFLATCGPNRL